MSTNAMKVLVVEDEKDIRDLLSLHLRRAGYTIDEAIQGEEALEKIKTGQYNLIVLDWMLPQTSGIDILRSMRDNPKLSAIPVLMVTAKASTSDIVFGLESGADDYITKPFEPVVFLARVRALMRRPTEGKEASSDAIQIGELNINPQTYSVSVKEGPLTLTPSEFKLLHALAINRGKVLTREKLIELVQGEGVAVIDRAIDTHVFGLRKKLGDSSNFIETVRGVGYRINIS
jgi:DNA-binding response OmpR family regulator